MCVLTLLDFQLEVNLLTLYLGCTAVGLQAMKDLYQRVRAHIHGCHSWRCSFIFLQLSACLCVYSVGYRAGERENNVREEGKREGKGGGGKREERIREKRL